MFVSLTLAIIVGSVEGVDGAVASFLPVWRHNTATVSITFDPIYGLFGLVRDGNQ